MLTFNDFFERIIDIQVEFSLAQKALTGWTNNQDALDRYATGALESLRDTFIRQGRRTGEDLRTEWPFTDQERINKYIEDIRTSAPRRVNELLPRLRQHEYLLSVTIFENFMKSIHREILRINPKLLKPDRKIDLGRLVFTGYTALIEEEIEREVQALDRESTEKKVRYFRDRLGINLVNNEKQLEILDSALAVRNQILHENPNRQLTEGECAVLMLVIMTVGLGAIVQAALLYPGTFELPSGISPEEAKRNFAIVLSVLEAGGAVT